MAKNKFQDVQQRLSEADLVDVERRLGIRIPDGVGRHYLENNGGTPERPCWELDNGEQLCISEFLAMKYSGGDSATLEDTYQSGLKKNILNPGMVPFARDWGGNYFVFDDQGQVFFYAMDAWSDKLTVEQNKKKAAKLLTRSFSTFVDKLMPDENA